MNKKECPKCSKFMVKWGGIDKNHNSVNIWKCNCGYEEVYKPDLLTMEELFKKKWEEANK